MTVESAGVTRGGRENGGGERGIIRRTWSNKRVLGDLKKEDLEIIMERLVNMMPRKVLGGKMLIEVYTGQSIALIALKPTECTMHAVQTNARDQALNKSAALA